MINFYSFFQSRKQTLQIWHLENSFQKCQNMRNLLKIQIIIYLDLSLSFKQRDFIFDHSCHIDYFFFQTIFAITNYRFGYKYDCI